MTKKSLDLTGKVCPYCLLAVQKEAKTMKPSDELVIACDHPPAVTASIPQFAKDNGLDVAVKLVSSGLWEIVLRKR